MSIFRITCNACSHIFYDIEVACDNNKIFPCVHCQSENTKKEVVTDAQDKHLNNKCAHGEEHLKKVKTHGGCHK